MIAYVSIDGRGKPCIRVDDDQDRLVAVFYGCDRADHCTTAILAGVVPALVSLLKVQEAKSTAAGVQAAE